MTRIDPATLDRLERAWASADPDFPALFAAVRESVAEVAAAKAEAGKTRDEAERQVRAVHRAVARWQRTEVSDASAMAAVTRALAARQEPRA